MIRLCIQALGLLAFLMGTPFSNAADTSPTKRPNILFLFTDDQRWDTVSALGNPEIQTPTFDRLVKEGFHFTNAYGMGSMIGAVCLPSRTMVATGRSLWKIPANPRVKQTPPGFVTLPGLLNEAGYVTFHSGKSGNSCTFANETFQIKATSDKRDVNTATETADAAITFLKGHDATKPFFMYIAPAVPHDPRLAPPEFVKRYDPAKLTLSPSYLARHPFDPGILGIRDEQLAPYPRTPEDMKQHLADYYATISHMDAEFARILTTLKERGMDQNTVIVFSSDQGLACGGYHGLMGKQNLYEHVKPPLVISGPGIPHGKSDALVYLFDLFPTILDLATVSIPPATEGLSLLPVARGDKTKLRDSLFGAYANNQRMIRDERWKLYQFNVQGIKHSQLFDLQADPHELHNLTADPAHAETLKRLVALLHRTRQELGDPVDFDSPNPQVPDIYFPAKGKGKLTPSSPK